jgi:GNAT superfamily N-acetyltransferase
MNIPNFRLATAEDAASLARLRAAFLAEVAQADAADPALLDALRRYFAAALPAGEFVAYLAEAGGEIVATSGLVFHRHAPSHHNHSGCEGYILNMYTLPAWRGRGIATTLLRKLLDVASERGCPRVSLHARPQGRPIYVKAGFVAVETEMRLALPARLP